MFSADMANEEWEVEISPSSRYYTEGELAFTVVAERGPKVNSPFSREPLPYSKEAVA